MKKGDVMCCFFFVLVFCEWISLCGCCYLDCGYYCYGVGFVVGCYVVYCGWYYCVGCYWFFLGWYGCGVGFCCVDDVCVCVVNGCYWVVWFCLVCCCFSGLVFVV